MSLAAVVLAAGEGTRMRSPLPKVLHSVAGRPMVLRVLDAVAGLRPRPDPIVVVVGHGADQVRVVLAAADVAVRSVYQERQLGTGDALRCAEPATRGLASDVLVLYGDTPLIRSTTLGRLVRAHRRRRATVTLITTCLEDPTGYGRVLRGADGSPTRIVEHRDASHQERQVTEINAGMYVFRDAWLWPALGAIEPSASGEVYLTDLVARALAAGEPVWAMVVPSPSEVLGVNTPDELAAAERRFRAQVAPGNGSAVPETAWAP